jgi:heat shock protein HtpX
MLVGIITISVLAPIAATLLRLAISRKREFLADASGALLTRYPDGLASALQKIDAAGMPMRRKGDAIAHIWLSDPTPNERKTSFLTRLFMTHPPVRERVQALREMSL